MSRVELALPPLPEPDAIELSPISDPADGERYFPATVKAYGRACADAAAPKWIPCSERLPEDGSFVLTWDGEGQAIDEWRDGKWQQHHAFMVAILGESYAANDPRIAQKSHWMPLPAPPKE